MNIGLGLLKIPVTNLEQSVTFYSTVLGADPAFKAEGFGWAHFVVEGLELALYVPGMGGGYRTPGGSVDFHLTHPDLRALQEKLRVVTQGASLFENADGSRSLEFSDPDGNDLKIMEVAAN